VQNHPATLSIYLALLVALCFGACAKDVGPGYAVYQAQNCAMCHGSDLRGTPSGPALSGIKEHWDAVKLSAYLKDPQGYADKDPRLAANREKFAMRMRPFSLSAADETALIDFLLSR
jgi:cytochrome c2